jgi:hypothetical protein
LSDIFQRVSQRGLFESMDGGSSQAAIGVGGLPGFKRHRGGVEVIAALVLFQMLRWDQRDFMAYPFRSS